MAFNENCFYELDLERIPRYVPEETHTTEAFRKVLQVMYTNFGVASGGAIVHAISPYPTVVWAAERNKFADYLLNIGVIRKVDPSKLEEAGA